MQPNALFFEGSDRGDGGYSEVQLVLTVVGAMVVCIALLSYFVLAPEYEKHLEKHYAAIAEEASRSNPIVPQDKSDRGLNCFGKNKRGRLARKHASLPEIFQYDTGQATLESISSEEDTFDEDVVVGRTSVCIAPSISASSSPSSSPQAYLQTLNANRRRKSESDALKEANICKAEMLRRRVLLRKLEKEIGGAIKESQMSSEGMHECGSQPQTMKGLSEERLKTLQAHPPDCSKELETLTNATNPEEVRRALHILHDVLSFYLSVGHRDLNKVTVFCNSLLKHDGLNRLRSYERTGDEEISALSVSIIEKAVPAIWH